MQNRASPPSPMFSRITLLLFWYVVPLSENQRSPAPGKEEVVHLHIVYAETCCMSKAHEGQTALLFKHYLMHTLAKHCFYSMLAAYLQLEIIAGLLINMMWYVVIKIGSYIAYFVGMPIRFNSGMFKRQFWQLWSLQNLPILATDNVCQFWQLMIFTNFGNW